MKTDWRLLGLFCGIAMTLLLVPGCNNCGNCRGGACRAHGGPMSTPGGYSGSGPTYQEPQYAPSGGGMFQGSGSR